MRLRSPSTLLRENVKVPQILDYISNCCREISESDYLILFHIQFFSKIKQKDNNLKTNIKTLQINVLN